MENKQDKGFTLVELLIVIVILGILATVTVFAVRGITDQTARRQPAALMRRRCRLPRRHGSPRTRRPSSPTAASGTGTVQGKLVDDGLMVDESTLFTVSANGTVSAVSGGDCA